MAILLTLPMGWVHSPLFFTAVTKTAVDFINQALRHPRDLGDCLHYLEMLALNPAGEDHKGSKEAQMPDSRAITIHQPALTRLVAFSNVYIDDFISLCQGHPECYQATTRIFLHTLNCIFGPLDTGDPNRREPVSTKKLLKGDTTWTTRKVILGWMIDTVKRTIELSPHRQECLCLILVSVSPGQWRASTKAWQKLLGELRSMSLAIPRSRGLFSTLQQALKTQETGGQVRLTATVHQFLDDFHLLARDLALRPTRLAKLLPGPPLVIRSTDALDRGMGGVAFVSTPEGTVPILWRH